MRLHNFSQSGNIQKSQRWSNLRAEEGEGWRRGLKGGAEKEGGDPRSLVFFKGRAAGNRTALYGNKNAPCAKA